MKERSSFEVPNQNKERDVSKYSKEDVKSILIDIFAKYEEACKEDKSVMFNADFFKKSSVPGYSIVRRFHREIGRSLFGEECSLKELIKNLFGQDSEIYKTFVIEKNSWTESRAKVTIKEAFAEYKRINEVGNKRKLNIYFFQKSNSKELKNLIWAFYRKPSIIRNGEESFKEFVERLFADDEEFLREFLNYFTAGEKGEIWDLERIKRCIGETFEKYKEEKKSNPEIFFNTSFFIECGIPAARTVINVFKKFPAGEGSTKNFGEYIKSLYGENSEIYMAFTYNKDFEASKRKKNKENEDIAKDSVKKDPEFRNLEAELKGLNQKVGELREKKKFERKEQQYFFGYGKCFEHYVGILLASENKNIEHQYKIETEKSFRLVDFYINGRGYISLEEIEEDHNESSDELIEVKSGVELGRRDREQLEDILQQSDKITYVVHDKKADIAKKLLAVAENMNKSIKIISFQELSSFSDVSDHKLSKMFVNKEEFSEFIKEKDKDQLEVDLFSMYLWVRNQENIRKLEMETILSAIYSQEEDFKISISEAYEIEWLTPAEYNNELMKIFSSERGRHYDPELVRKKLISKIIKVQTEIAALEGKEEYTEFMKKKDDYEERRNNFTLLENLMKEIPDSSSSWGNPPVRYVYSEGEPASYLLVEIDKGANVFEVDGIGVHKKRIREWIRAGKIHEVQNKYFKQSLENKYKPEQIVHV